MTDKTETPRGELTTRMPRKIKAGETIVIPGANSGVGIAAIQIALRQGCKVITTVSGSERFAKAKALGADLVIDRRKDDWVELARDLLRLFRDNSEGTCCFRDAACDKLLPQTLAEFRGNSYWTDALGDFCWQLRQPFLELLMESDCISSGRLNGLDAVV